MVIKALSPIIAMEDETAVADEPVLAELTSYVKVLQQSGFEQVKISNKY